MCQPSSELDLINLNSLNRFLTWLCTVYDNARPRRQMQYVLEPDVILENDVMSWAEQLTMSYDV